MLANFYIESTGDIDYSILSRNIKKTETTPPELISNKLLKHLLQSSSLTDKEKSILEKLILRQKTVSIIKYPYQRTKTGTFIHEHEFLYKNGISQHTSHTLVKIDLIPCFIQLIKLISNISDTPQTEDYLKIEQCSDDIARLISGTVSSDKETQEILTKLISIENLYLNSYIKKSLDLSNKPNIIIYDAFNVKRTYNYLYPIEAIIIPISYSLYALQYAIAEKISLTYKRGERKFACIDKYRMYYHVRNDMLSDFMNTEIFIDNRKLNITFESITPKIEICAGN